jgi:hypothetical protein
MRLWSLHPRYLDSAGLIAVWREALLAQKVLMGETTGYRRHPQLERFRMQRSPVAAIATYLDGIYREAGVRGYCFDKAKIERRRTAVKIAVTSGQVSFELEHLRKKLSARNPSACARLRPVKQPKLHPLFARVPGPIEAWEVIRR